MDWLREVLPFVLPLLGGFAATALAPVLGTSKHLRENLARDTEMLERIPSGARAQLREDIKRRTHMLVSVSRFPPLQRTDVLLLLAALATGTAAYPVLSFTFAEDVNQLSSTWDLLTGPGFVVVLSCGSCLAIWVQMYWSWAMRALDRVAYIQMHLGRDACDEVIVVQRFSRLALIVVVAAPVAVAQAWGLLIALSGFQPGWFSDDLHFGRAAAALTGLLVFVLLLAAERWVRGRAGHTAVEVLLSGGAEAEANAVRRWVKGGEIGRFVQRA